MGFLQPARRAHLLAPGHLGFAHAGLPVIRVEPRSASPGQRRFSYRQRAAAAAGIAPYDGGLLAERDGGGALCAAPVAGGHGRVDHGAEECAEHILLAADRVGVCEICGKHNEEDRD